MQYKKVCGQEAIEFALISGLVIVVSLFALFILGGKVAAIFTDGATTKQGNTSITPNNNTINSFNIDYNQAINDIQATPPVTNPPATTDSCTSTDCTLQLGNLTLTDVRKDFNDIVQTTGASGGTEVLLSHIDQIAAQIEEQGLTEEASEIKMLSSFGHNIAALEKTYEQVVDQCQGSQTCLKNIATKPFPKPQNYDERFGKFPEGLTYVDFLQMTSVGWPAFTSIERPDIYKSYLAQGRTNYLLHDKYKTISQLSTLDSTTQNVLKELYWDIGLIGEDFENNIRFLMGESSGFHDPLNGGSIGIKVPADPINNYMTYNASKLTNYDSALICAAGAHEDSGTRCH